MLINHFKTSMRYLTRNRTASLINIIGLSIAFATAFLILQYLDFELSYDQYLPEHEQVYRVTTDQFENGAFRKASAETYFGVADWLGDNFSDVKAATRFYRWPANAGVLIQVDGKLYEEKKYLFADKHFFHVFPSLLNSGDASTCLAQPNSVVISETLALKMFGTTDVVGKTVLNPERRNKFMTITGVMRSTPANSHFDAEVVEPYEWIPDQNDEWKVMVWTYIRVGENTDIGTLEHKMNDAVVTMLKTPKEISSRLRLQSIASIHLSTAKDSEAKQGGSLLYVYVIGGALVLILAIAWINYINLETARFIKRAKDVGLRRIIGSSKQDLFARFFMEYMCVTGISVVLAILIITLTFPYFGYVTGMPLSSPVFNVDGLWITATGAFIVATILAGAYPFLSVLKLNPIATLKGKVVTGFKGVFLQRSLLAVQFIASLTLMALVLTAGLQLDFMRRVNSNIKLDHVVSIHNPANYSYYEDSLRKETNDAFRNQLMQIPSIENLTTSSAIPGEAIGFTYTDLAKRSLNDPDRGIGYKVMYIDYDFIPVFNLELLEGRNYSPEYSDVNCLVVTESTIRELGFRSAAEALNQKIYFQEEEWEQWTIIGIVRDYRHESVKTPTHPGIFRLHRYKGQMVYYSVKLAAGSDPSKVVPMIEDIWKQAWPGKPFDYFFMDQHYDQQYKSEIHFSRVFSLFSGIAVFIACLGVMGMTLFEANSRMKEISIRKVLGAEIVHIVSLLTKQSFRLLIVSFVVALPLVYFLSSQWLTAYPVRIGFSMWLVLVPLGILGTLVSSVSIGQVLKAAVRNPVDSLKQE